MERPLLSVVIPTCNRSRLGGEAAASALARLGGPRHPARAQARARGHGREAG
ncbi:MAG TPA: hypothetical protein VN256_23380 [Pyrinomonadaceae bacterium]|nr:hypothetical protein [Pyrinomonadaceae bacterium]